MKNELPSVFRLTFDNYGDGCFHGFYRNDNMINGNPVSVCSDFILAVMGVKLHELPKKIKLTVSLREKKSKVGWVPCNITNYLSVNHVKTDIGLLPKHVQYLSMRGMLDKTFYVQIEIDDFD